MLSILLLVSLLAACSAQDTQPPRVVSTFPENGSQNVDPSLTELTVRFDEEMKDQNWSWVYEEESTFPTVTGQASYSEQYTKNVLPVKLEPNKEYVVWINSTDSRFQNFQDKAGNPAAAFKVTFRTESEEFSESNE